jgi:hypothetical protein
MSLAGPSHTKRLFTSVYSARRVCLCRVLINRRSLKGAPNVPPHGHLLLVSETTVCLVEKLRCSVVDYTSDVPVHSVVPTPALNTVISHLDKPNAIDQSPEVTSKPLLQIILSEVRVRGVWPCISEILLPAWHKFEAF